MSDRFYSVKEAAELLKVHWQTVRGYIQSGKLSAVKAGRQIRILESDLDAFLHNQPKSKREVEVEIRFLTDKRREIEEKLIRLGAKVVFHGHVIDHWFVPNEIKNLEQKNEAYDSGRGFGLRIREQDNGYTGKMATTIEVKRLAVPNKHDTCIEQEMAVENYLEASKLLNQMNMKEITTLDKDRLVYKIGDYKVVIDDIKGYKTGVELELVTVRDREEVLTELKNLAIKLGLSLENMAEKSVTWMYMQNFARF